MAMDMDGGDGGQGGQGGMEADFGMEALEMVQEDAEEEPLDQEMKIEGKVSLGNEDISLEDSDLLEIVRKDTIFYSAIGLDLSTNNIQFQLPDRVGKFKVQVIGISQSGVYGVHTSFLQIQKPFNASLDYPTFIRQDDTIKLSLLLENNST